MPFLIKSEVKALTRGDVMMTREWVKRCCLLALLGSGLIGGGYGQAWVPMIALFRRKEDGGPREE